ncbi:hypothetical protein LIER_31834 [Lithospermum erythrorhizon]|uniref:Galactose oxidase n=1 Tax=Lithospermum erythrorhizon TaxID=34254 RepID=A0AAV3RXF9_LITER
MVSNNPHFYLLFITITICCLFSHSSPSQHYHHHHSNLHEKPKVSPERSVAPPRPYPFNTPHFYPQKIPPQTPTGQWTLLQRSIGISAMHMQLLHNNKVVIFDRTDFGPSNLSLPAGKCRRNDAILPLDCTAHSIIYDIATNSYRPLMVQTDVWCSSAAVRPDGTLIQTGGFLQGDHKIRLFSPCDDDACDWVELPQNLSTTRWYSSDQILPDGRVIIVGGRGQFSYEFFPKNGNNEKTIFLNFLNETNDPGEENNLYPFLHLLPDGNLYIFANQRSILLDYVNNKVLKEFPKIPEEKRSYPATGSSVMLPLNLTRLNGSSGVAPPSPVVEIMVCGGNSGGAYTHAEQGIYLTASKTCGRIKVTDPNPIWVMEDMPTSRVMPDILLLPTGHVIILNGAGRGTGGWTDAIDPILKPILYRPEEPHPIKRFTICNPTGTARMYHSSAILLPDGSILVGGSNPNINYNFTGVRYPTDLSLEKFFPPYMAPMYSYLRPSIMSIQPSRNNIICYGQSLSITLGMGFDLGNPRFMVTMIAPSFTTHSFAMNQRLLVLDIVHVQWLSPFARKVTVSAPSTVNIAPPGYYMIFVVHQGVPSHAVWIKMTKT